MPAFTRRMLLCASLSTLLAVIFGAFGAHALRDHITPDLLAVYRTGVQYHFYHSLGLCAVAFVAFLLPASTYVRWAGWSMIFGIVLFSGSLYLLAITGIGALGAITPIGGVAFMAAWISLAIGVLKER